MFLLLNYLNKQKIEIQKAANQAAIDKTRLKSLSVSKAAYSKMYFWLLRLPIDAKKPKKNIYITSQAK